MVDFNMLKLVMDRISDLEKKIYVLEDKINNNYNKQSKKKATKNFERWKDIKGYNGDYQISDRRRVKSFKKHGGTSERILKYGITDDEQLYVSLYKNSKSKIFLIDKLVAEYFPDKINNKKDFEEEDPLAEFDFDWQDPRK